MVQQTCHRSFLSTICIQASRLSVDQACQVRKSPLDGPLLVCLRRERAGKSLTIRGVSELKACIVPTPTAALRGTALVWQVWDRTKMMFSGGQLATGLAHMVVITSFYLD